MKKRKKARRTSDGLIIVQSKSYGEHTRAKRGTYQEAPLNPSMQNSCLQLSQGNRDASLIRAALLPHFLESKPFRFWPRLLSAVRLAYGKNDLLDPGKFNGFDVYEEYKITRLTSPQTQLSGDDESTKIEVSWHAVPNFRRKFADGYFFGVVCLFIDPESGCVESSVSYSRPFPLSVTTGSCEFEVAHQLHRGYMLLFLLLNATEKNVLKRGAPTSGFRCIGGKWLGQKEPSAVSGLEMEK
ncbi:hypothetical protein [Pedobacter sp. SYSU D00535]|uniref:hypothetical protein n=1 Tax=Pedobacter sp. SYSU D00535 TaxID=2810308 RepID=UPI001A96E7BA|nr:hypothetical protein [Pedobacter sp. SYSU D00535]